MTGEEPFECMIRESNEEASLPEDYVRAHAKEAGMLEYIHITDERSGGEPGGVTPALGSEDARTQRDASQDEHESEQRVHRHPFIEERGTVHESEGRKQVRDERADGDPHIELRVVIPSRQARWLSRAAQQTGETEAELIQQAIQLLMKASAYKREVRSTT